MKIRTILSIIAGVIIVLIVAAVVVLQSIDVNQYRNVIAETASSMTGRKLTMAGPIELSVGWSPLVVINEVQLANAKWGTRPDMVRLKKLEVQVRLLPLLYGNIEVKRLILVEPDIWLETDRRGRGNWELGLGKPGDGKENTAAGDPTIPLVSDFRLLKPKVSFTDGKSGQKYSLALEKIEAQTEGFDAPLRFVVAGKLNQLPLSIKGQVGPIASIKNASRPYPLDITAQLAGLNLKAKGTVTDLIRVKNIDLKVTAEAKSLLGLQPIAGDMVVKMGPFSFRADVQGNLSKVQLRGMKFVLGRTDVGGHIEASLTGDTPKISADLNSTRFDLNDLVPEEEAGSKTKGKNTPKKLFSEDPLPLKSLKLLDADLQFSGKEIHARGLVLRAAKIRLSLQDGKMSVTSLEGQFGGGTLKGGMELDARPSQALLSVNLKGSKFDLGEILKEVQINDLYQGKGDLAMNLKGRGNSVAAIMASLNGETMVILGQGKLKSEALDLAVGGFSKVLGTLIAGKKTFSVVNCAVNKFTVKNGIAKNQVMLVDTEYSTVVGKGEIDLVKETLNLIIAPQSKAVTLNVAFPVKVGGTLASPTFRPDEWAVAKKLGGIAALFVFPPAAFLGFGDLGSDEGEECLNIAKGKAPIPASQKPSTTEKVLKSVGGGIKGVGERLKGLFGK